MLARNRAERKSEPNRIESASGVLEFDAPPTCCTPICRVRRGGTRPGGAAGKRECPCSCNMNRITRFRRGALGLGGLVPVARGSPGAPSLTGHRATTVRQCQPRGPVRLDRGPVKLGRPAGPARSAPRPALKLADPVRTHRARILPRSSAGGGSQRARAVPTSQQAGAPPGGPGVGPAGVGPDPGPGRTGRRRWLRLGINLRAQAPPFEIR